MWPGTSGRPTTTSDLTIRWHQCGYAQRAAHAAIHVLAHDLVGGRWLLTGGGGYDLVRVVPRTWTHLLAEAAGQPINPAMPNPRPVAGLRCTANRAHRTRAHDR